MRSADARMPSTCNAQVRQEGAKVQLGFAEMTTTIHKLQVRVRFSQVQVQNRSSGPDCDFTTSKGARIVGGCRGRGTAATPQGKL